MKNINSIFFSFFILSFFSVYSQEQKTLPDPNGNHEVRLNILGFIVPGVFDIAYEHLLDESQGVGFQSSLYLMDQEEIEYSYNYSFSAHYRLYTSSKRYAAGFFIQAGLNIASVPVFNYGVPQSTLSSTRGIDDEFFIGPEVGLGGKWVVKKGIVVELGGTISRAVNSVESDGFNQNFWLSLGKRF